MRRFLSGMMILVAGFLANFGMFTTVLALDASHLQLLRQSQPPALPPLTTAEKIRLLEDAKLIQAAKIIEANKTSPQADQKTKHTDTQASGTAVREISHIPWETIAVVISIFSGIAAITGFTMSGHKKKRAISKYMEEIDMTFSEYKFKSKRCEAELYRLRDLLEHRLKKGQIDESLYELLTKRIDKYIHEIQSLP